MIRHLLRRGDEVADPLENVEQEHHELLEDLDVEEDRLLQQAEREVEALGDPVEDLVASFLEGIGRLVDVIDGFVHAVVDEPRAFAAVSGKANSAIETKPLSARP